MRSLRHFTLILISLSCSSLTPSVRGQDVPDLPESVFEIKEDAPAQGVEPCCPGALSMPVECCCDDACGSVAPWWKKVPPVRPLPPLGHTGPAPTGPGYYSVLDLLTGNYRQQRPKDAYVPFALMAPPFFDIDFRYLDDPAFTDRHYSDMWHRIHLGDHWLFATGGSFWSRWVNEVNSRLSGQDNNYDLIRVRAFGDLWYEDRFRFYIEFIYADALYPNLPPLLIDEDLGDFLNLFVEAKLCEFDGKNVYARVGRQELLFGSQRLISPLEWANTRRTFQGARVYRQGEYFDFDMFWAQPVRPNPTRLDSVDNNQNFAGAWATFKPKKGRLYDFYYLNLDNTNQINRLGIQQSPYNVSTLGTRAYGTQNQWLWDVELMMQLGERGAQNIVAGATTAGMGYNFKNLPGTPTFWQYYDYASGDNTPGVGNDNTFNQLFPFGHYYLGWLDLVARQNLHDVNSHLIFYPNKWIQVWLQYHHYELAASQDALYNAGGLATRRDPTGVAGSHVGEEFDLIVNFHLSRHMDILCGYSKLYQGRFLEQTGPGPSPELFFCQYNYRW